MSVLATSGIILGRFGAGGSSSSAVADKGGHLLDSGPPPVV